MSAVCRRLKSCSAMFKEEVVHSAYEEEIERVEKVLSSTIIIAKGASHTSTRREKSEPRQQLSAG